MDFTLTDEQQMVRDTAATMLAKECPPALLRAHMDDPAAADPLWVQLADWAVLGDGSLVDLALFMEELGAVAAPGPYFATAGLFLPLVRAAATSDPERTDLADLAGAAAEGRITGTVAMAGAGGVWKVCDDPVRTFVLEADRVDNIAVVVPGPAVIVVQPEVAAQRRIGSLDSTRRVFEIDTPTGDAAPISDEALTGVLQRAWVALAAEMVGTARTMLRWSVDYAKERVQFDRPIGSFQAIQHKLADMALDFERAAAAVAYAAMTMDAEDPDRHRAVHVAKAAAGTAVRHCAKSGIQTHGGIGYTWEHDLHLFIRRAYGQEHLLGTTAWHHDRLADLLFEG